MDVLGLVLGGDAQPGQNEDQTDQKKRDKKKVVPAKQMKKQQAKVAEEAKQQIIKQKQEFLKDTKKRVEMEWDNNYAKSQVYAEEYEHRLKLLQFSFQRLLDIEKNWNYYLKEMKMKDEWLKFIRGGLLPNPSCLVQMNMYIFVWTVLEPYNDMSYCIAKTEEVMKLLSDLQKLINNPGPGRPPNFVNDMKEDNIDRATFHLFSRIGAHMEPINVTTSKYLAKCPHFVMNLWAELYTPIPLQRGKDIRTPLKINFKETEITAILPVSLLYIQKVMRAMWLNFDHWTDKCRTYDCPTLPYYFGQNLLDLFRDEFLVKKTILEYRERLKVRMKKKVAAIPLEPTLSQEILAWNSEPHRPVSEEVMYQESKEEDSLGMRVKEFLNEFEVNLRERSFLGDLLLLEVLKRPPQPTYLRFKYNVTLRQENPGLYPVNYYVKYPPSELDDLDDEDTPTGFSMKIDLEEEMKKLVIIKLKPCQTVLWFENPEVANWDPAHGYWSSEDIHDIKYDNEYGTITFRTGRLGLMGLHVSRYINLPYQDWSLEANEEDGVNFYLKTDKIELNFKIREGEVCLENMINVPSKAMNWILGNYYPLDELIEHMKKGGIDIFPPPDAGSYIKNVRSKNFVVENNIYLIWGLFCQCFRFKRSKFNQVAERGHIVFQAQEIFPNYQIDFCLLNVSMCSCYVMDINEESQNYSPDPVPGMKTAVDLHTLLNDNCTQKAKRQSEATSFVLIQTVKDFMSSVRPLSFS